MELTEEIMKKVEYWSKSQAFDHQTRQEIQKLYDENAEKELNDRFFKDLSFGTGGMRGVMGAGTDRMNVYNISKATTALGLYLIDLNKNSKDSHQIKVAISYDSRNNSKTFAEKSAEILSALGIQSYITKVMRPVPMLSFMVRHYKCDAGICITASHNPPAYNGFKVYWKHGGQLTPPHDKNILEYYNRIENYEQLNATDYQEGIKTEKIVEVLEELDQEYFLELKQLKMQNYSNHPMKIVYSPIHGTGIYAVPKALNEFGFSNLFIPEEQKEPDGNFPTVKSPNPEDQEALEIALNLGREKNAKLILATDPDSDRIACIVNENDQFISFTGNQLCCLMTEYLLSTLSKKNQLNDHSLVVSTIVTTDLHRKIALFYKTSCELTLTGFKWICQLAEDYEQGIKKPYKKFICGGEESYGFLIGNFVRDKDAISACALAAEMVAYYSDQNKTLSEVLDEIYLRHGVYEDSLYNMVLPGQSGFLRIKNMMKHFRENPPEIVGNAKLIKIKDFKLGHEKILEKSSAWNEFPLTDFPSSDVLQFEFDNGTRISIRPSGTEPKIKFYISTNVSIEGKNFSSLPEAKELCKKSLKYMENQFVRIAETIY